MEKFTRIRSQRGCWLSLLLPLARSNQHANLVDDRMDFALSIAKLRLDNSRLRLLIYEAHDLNWKARHAQIILLSNYSGDFERIVVQPDRTPFWGLLPVGRLLDRDNEKRLSFGGICGRSVLSLHGCVSRQKRSRSEGRYALSTRAETTRPETCPVGSRE